MGVALADDVDDQVAAGETFAKQGEWTQAIAAFKAADATRPRAKHACLIGLAYTRRELWPQAEVFFGRCRARISSEDPAPEWLADAEHTLAAKLATSSAAAVTFAVTPSTALAQISVSAFAPDETFAPRTIHLAPGTYTITVRAPEYVTATRTVVIDKSTRDLAVTAELTATDAVRPPPRHSRVPAYTLLAGGAITVLGLVHHVALTRSSRDALVDASTHADYEANHERFLDRRRITLGLYGVGALTVVTGLVLRATVFRRRSPVELSAAARDGGAVVTIGWHR